MVKVTENKNTSNKKTDWGLTAALILLFVGLSAIFLPYYKLNGTKFWGSEIQISNYGELGDFIAGITGTLISVAAFILLYLTYKTQKQELSETRDILNKQHQTFEKQQFETTFFNLLNLHDSIVNSIDFKTIHTTTSRYKVEKEIEIKKGRDCFVLFYRAFQIHYGKVRSKQKSVSQLELIKTAYENFFEDHKTDLGHYFRNLYHIIKFIDRSEIMNKQQYASIVRAQLSSHELLLLFYNGLSKYGKKFKPLIERYRLLKNLHESDLLVQTHKDEYSVDAFIRNNRVE